MSQQLGDLGFAKIKGYSFWPARLAGQSGRRLWVKFYGTGQFGSILNDKNHWLILSDITLAKFAPQNFKKPNYLKAVREMIATAKVGTNINNCMQYNLIYFNFLSNFIQVV